MWVGIQPSEGLSGTKTTVPGRKGVPGLAEHSAGSIHGRFRTAVQQTLCSPTGGRGRWAGVSAEAGGTGATPSPAQPEPWPSLACRAGYARQAP